MKPNPQISIMNRTSASGSISDWCYFSKPTDEIEVCEWANGEGFDVNIHRSETDTKFQLTWGEWEMMQQLVKVLV